MSGQGIITSGTSGTASRERIERVVLDGEALTRLSPLQEADQNQATQDLAAENKFALAGRPGPMRCISRCRKAGWCSMFGTWPMRRCRPWCWLSGRSAG